MCLSALYLYVSYHEKVRLDFYLESLQQYMVVKLLRYRLNVSPYGFQIVSLLCMRIDKCLLARVADYFCLVFSCGTFSRIRIFSKCSVHSIFAQKLL